MKQSFIEAVNNRVLLADGGIGSQIYQNGFFVNRCYDHLNLTNPETIRAIHADYVGAGAELIRTNTLGANRLKLADHGLADQLEAINIRGVELAREAGDESLYVAGVLGPIRDGIDLETDRQIILEAYTEQASILIKTGVDVLILESLSNLDEMDILRQAINLVDKDITVIPSFLMLNPSARGEKPLLERVNGIKKRKINFFAINGCGPTDLFEVMPTIQKATENIKTVFFPTAGTPSVVDGRMLYFASPEYIAEYTRRFIQNGAAIVGGCGGITPEMIKEVALYLRSFQPRKIISFSSKIEVSSNEEIMTPVPIKERSYFGSILDEKFVISVELDPPKGIDVTKSIEGAKFLKAHGIDVINIADGPRASGRMSPTALTALVNKEVEIDTIIHVCCRDRNLLALQMDIISANQMGMHNLMIITGDPPKMGIYPDATAVFDLDAVGLTAGANMMNHGLDFARRPLKGQTSFVLGVGCNPGAADLDREVKRYEEKVDAGAEFVFSQPIYDPELLNRFLTRIAYVKPIPFFVGVLPLASYKNAEFFTNEVPGMQVPRDIMERMRKAPTKEEQRKEGVKIAAESLVECKRHAPVKGAYIFPPFGRYQSVLDVIELSGVI